MTQAERLAKREALRAEIAKAEAHVRELVAQERLLLAECTHAYSDGKTALVGGRTKVCVHCGRLVARREEKLWG